MNKKDDTQCSHPPGIVCPKCSGVAVRVIRTQHTSFGTINRRRQCVGCGVRFTTRETVIKFPK